MNPRRQAVIESLTKFVAQLDPILRPWGFTFVSDGYPCHSETETFTIIHGTLMEGLGHAGDCWFGYKDGVAIAKGGPGGDDVVQALIHDLEVLAAPVLRQPCDEFQAIMRRGDRRPVVYGKPIALIVGQG